jgi:uncharacterized protein
MTDATAASPFRPGRPFWLTAIFGAELVGLALAYQFLADIECRYTSATFACDLLRGMVLRALVVLGVVALLIRAWPAIFAEFLAASREHRDPRARNLHLAGIALMLLPLALSWGGNLSAHFTLALVPWLGGAALAVVGGLLWLAPRRAWVRMLWTRARSAIPILAAAALVPDLVNQVRPIWAWQALTAWTFESVAALLRLFTPAVEVISDEFVIGIEEFYVSIAPQCSGVEGFALVATFVAVYAFIFRSEVRLGRFLLVMLPLGLLCSWILNVVRISLLILIGARVSPDIAVNGFHSYAGWLMFTALAFGLMAIAQLVPWLHREGLRTAPVLPLRHDPVAAQILPFAVFMVTSTLIAALFLSPGFGMPLVTVALAGAALIFLPVYRALPWQPDVLSLAAGLAVGVGWIATAPQGQEDVAAAVAGLPLWAASLWVVTRILGTTILVPLVEEMFFRGYLLARLDGHQLWRRVVAIVLSSAAFALLHGRWVEAFVAGLVFAAVMLRRGRVTDAIWAHVTANAAVAAVAAWRGDWGLI